MDEPLTRSNALTQNDQEEFARIHGEAALQERGEVTTTRRSGLLLIAVSARGVAATLGPIRVDIERPRDRRAINHPPPSRSTSAVSSSDLFVPMRRSAQPPVLSALAVAADTSEAAHPKNFFLAPPPRQFCRPFVFAHFSLTIAMARS